MTTSRAGSAAASASLPVLDMCWNQIGVRGDRSCPKLNEAVHCHNCSVFSAAAQTLLNRPADPAYLSELTAFVSEPLQTRKGTDSSAVLFRTGGESFALETGLVIEVGDAVAPRRIPHRSNEVLVGLIHVQGRLELCISLCGLLDLPRPRSTPGQPVRVLVASCAGQRWVFLVDSVAGIQRYHRSQLVEAPATSRAGHACVSGLIAAEGSLFALLDLARICDRIKERLR